MQMTEVTYADAIPIDSYGPGFFRIGGEVIEGGAVIHAKGARSWAGYEDAQAVLALAEEIDFILMGTGPDMAPVPAAFRETLEAAGIGVEPMASPSACRTYNVLVSEGRRVAAVLLPV
ncbi:MULTISPECIES: Mth938-like domain-containing protein [unclassified Shimia]|uniref:Mth938-like domain-containing protein n=1 Tax=unclassified Shimia TaxID=2630038 RepID=UPI001ADCC545|nr:Mth938-like domain-containing protein [Shimia sp. R9_3]MBO9400889.1 Mth938-like domain-containing protein [Shimia sp. R9_3]